MLILITGGSKCGKSALAEKILSEYTTLKYYIATMRPFGKDAHEAIERHRRMREGKGFVTVEKYTDIHEIIFPPKSCALLECIGNLCANEMFEKKECDTVDKILKGITNLQKYCSVLVIVTNQVGEDGIFYSHGTMKYIETMGKLNQRIAAKADCVVEVVFGIPVVLKGALPICP